MQVSYHQQYDIVPQDARWYSRRGSPGMTKVVSDRCACAGTVAAMGYGCYMCLSSTALKPAHGLSVSMLQHVTCCTMTGNFQKWGARFSGVPITRVLGSI